MNMTSVRGQFAEVSILVNSMPQPILIRQRDGQPFVEARRGMEYVLQVRNLTGGRILALTSVDGNNTQWNEPADEHTNRGMIVPEWGVVKVRGFRLNDTDVKAFEFGEPGESVAAITTGSTRNVGVIGLAVYPELGYNTQTDNAEEYILQGGGTLSAEDSAKSPVFGTPRTSKSDAGTEAGRRMTDKITYAHFERGTTDPIEVMAIQYRYRPWLVREGILRPDPSFPGDPNPFPGSGNPTGYGNL